MAEDEQDGECGLPIGLGGCADVLGGQEGSAGCSGDVGEETIIGVVGEDVCQCMLVCHSRYLPLYHSFFKVDFFFKEYSLFSCLNAIHTTCIYPHIDLAELNISTILRWVGKIYI